jgi:hypothetical protein
MAVRAAGRRATGTQSAVGPAAGWYALALFACLWAVLVNGGPFFYWDTVGYIVQGRQGMEIVGLAAGAPAQAPAPAVAAAEATGAAQGALAQPAAPDRTVDGSRSLTYSMLVGFLAHFRALELMVLLQSLAVILGAWIVARVVTRTYAPHLSAARVVGISVGVAGLGSLPFIAGYLMPDVFAALMVLMIATLAAFARDMRPAEVALGLGLAAVATVAHLSHLAIAILLLPAVLIVAFAFRRGRPLAAFLIVGLLVGIGAAQQAVVRMAADRVAGSEVVIRPFITARLIADGPGFDYLAETCPDVAEPTCLLYGALMTSDDPWRLTASHIVFETKPGLASLRLLTAAEQVAVARGQVQFFFRVLADRPLATTYAFLRNTFVQAGMFSVSMSMPTPNMVAQHDGVEALAAGPFRAGRLNGEQGWLRPYTLAQAVLYAGSLVIILAAIGGRMGLPASLRAFAALVVLGVLANAFVCGGISQPAVRYGARVIWLLPLVAALLLMLRGRGERIQ